MESSQIRFFFIRSLKLCMYIEPTRSQKGKVHIQRLNSQFHQLCWSDFFILVINSQSLKNRIPKIVEAHFHNSIFVFSVCHKVLPYSLSIVLICALKMFSAVLLAFIIIYFISLVEIVKRQVDFSTVYCLLWKKKIIFIKTATLPSKIRLILWRQNKRNVRWKKWKMQ